MGLRAMVMVSDDFEDIVDEIPEDIDCDEEQDWCMEDDEDDVGLASTGGLNADDDFFDASIGVLEEIIMGEEFNQQQHSFMEAHCEAFDRDTELKLEFTEIFQEYTAILEHHIEDGLTQGVPDFSMERFLGLLEKREEEVSTDVFDMLLSLSDFEMFRTQMCEFKEQCMGKGGEGFAAENFLCISGCPVHEDEQEDGEARPDLNCFLDITNITPDSSPMPSPC